jgi:molybdopterin-guanine dinucleotide biosynthesis protein A
MTTAKCNSIPTQDITGVILSGGQGTRMGGLDKGLENFLGCALVSHVLDRLSPQVGKVMINANRNLPLYQALCEEVYPDPTAGHEGPLTGFWVGLKHAQTPFVLTVPCDCPMLPLNLATRLGQGLMQHHAQLAMVRAPSAGKLKPQPVFALMRTEVRESLKHFMDQGGRKIQSWSHTLNCVFVDFDQASDDPLAFSNLNTLEDLHSLERSRRTLHLQA